MSDPDFDTSGFPLNVSAAKKVLDRLRRRRGHIDAFTEDQLRTTDASFQDGHRQMAAELREVYARYTRDVAEQLYSTKFRFIYELLQNGDDARYAKDVEPTITFRIKPSELTIESNEQGFSLRDVESICNTGKSSKVDNSETTGEKGLGFKSVFGIADYVHIESGLWSFRFEHKEGEDGVGMITPIWTDVTSSLPSNVGTRCTLRYSDNHDGFPKLLVSQFEKLPKTMMFALRQLRRLIVVVENVDGRSDQITFTKDGDLSSKEMHLNSIVTGQFGDHRSETTRLRLFKNAIVDMPLESKRTNTTSHVIVAFEVDLSGLPVIPTRGQHVFAYLPVQRIPQLPFLIHADFVLAASREAIDDRDWNQALRGGIVSAFINFVMELVRPGDALEFTWMRYLPGETMEGFWEDLYADIKEGLFGRSILRSHRGCLHDLTHMKLLPDWFLYESQPLLPDTDDDIYLSSSYEPSDVEALEELGLQEISAPQILTRMKLGLSANAETRIHDIPLGNPWHTAFATLVEELQYDDDSVKSEIQRLDFIPLNNNSWVSPSSLRSDAVYFPYIIEGAVNIEVPDRLGLRKLHPTAAGDGERAKFYTSLGIVSCPHDIATQKVLKAHKSRRRPGCILDFIQDLEILFWFGEPVSQSQIRHTDLLLVDDQNKSNGGDFLFFPSEEEFHSQKLLSATPRKDFSGYGILHPRYMRSQVRQHIRHGLDWISWLQKCGVSYFPPLTERQWFRHTLNPLMTLIARDNPNSFVANLKEHWSDYRQCATEITQDLKIVSVPCQNGSSKQLGETILPTPLLVQKSKELNMEGSLPFLKLPGEHGIQDSELWFFLKDFGVICEPNADFYLTALRLLNVSTETQLIPVCSRIYAGIAQTTTGGDAGALQEAFSNEPLIRTAEAWCQSSGCVWEGPVFLRAKSVLSPVYGADPNASKFFKTFLDMQNVEYTDLIEELEILSEENDVSPSLQDQLTDIYTVLADMARSESIIEDIRENFNTLGLIFASGRWLKPSECLWNCTVAISGRVPLDQVYPRLKGFFVNKIKVTTMNINVLIQELTKTAKKDHPDFDEIKRIMLAIGQILAAGSSVKINEEFLKSLKKTAFLPVCCPSDISLFSIRQLFFINDHKRYGELFKNKAKILDFSHEEMTSLNPFFDQLGLRGRYLSEQVSANTTARNFTPNESLEFYIRDRAYAFSCCASSYNSPKYYNRNTSMHQSLLNPKVFVCEEMWTELTVNQEDEAISVQNDRAVVKVSQDGGTLALYVPSDYDGLYSCFHTELPGALARHLDIQDRAAVKVIYRILNDVEKGLDTIMRDEDLCDYTWLEKPVPSQQSSLFPAPNSTEHPTVDPPTIDDETLLAVPTNQSGNLPSPQATDDSPAPPIPVWQQVARTKARTEQYEALLREVVRQAKRGQSSRNGSLSLVEMEEALDDLNNTVDYASFYRTFRSPFNSNSADNFQIGAAGELYVFEFLKSSGVSNFTIYNWQSSIRHHVNILPEYKDMLAWPGMEISDIMYKGNSPDLMDILRRNTTLPYPAWLESVTTSTTVHYHIEVKTTPGPCGTPFIMSGNQYRLMREKACEPRSPRAPQDLFVIMRVFNLFSSKIGLQVYINPWHLRDTALDFVADPWKVMPHEIVSAN